MVQTAVDSGSMTQRERWFEALDTVVGALDSLPLSEVQDRCVQARSRFEAAEVRRLAAEVTADGDTSRARRLAGASGKRSKRAARAAGARAAAVSKNPSLADDLASGELSDEQLDTIADAMATDESAATDQDFIDSVKKRSVDQGRKLAKDRKTKQRSGESDAERQRRLRSARRFEDRAAGLSAVNLSGDDATVNELWRLVRAKAKQMHEADGGRDLARHLHPRTLDQRLFDAMAALIRGDQTTVRAGGRASAVVTVPVDGSGIRTANGDPVSDDVAIDLLQRAGITVMLTDKLTGDPLWLSRTVRHASAGQFLALVVRDGGCVLCNADWAGCEAHHLTPWHAPAQGATDIDEMALVCVDCHHHIHQAQLTLERLEDGRWKTRPAAPDEIAPVGTRNQPAAGPGRQPRRSRSQAQTQAQAAKAQTANASPGHTQSSPSRNPTAQPGTQRTAPGEDPADLPHE